MNVATVDFLSPGRDELTAQPKFDSRTPWLLCIYCLLLTVIPSDVVYPSVPANLATPARMFAGAFTFLALVSFIAPRHRNANDVRLNPGVLFLGAFVSLVLLYWAQGLFLRGTPTQEASKSTAFSGALIAAGVGLYTLIQLNTARKRSIVLGFLVAGITYSAVIGILQHTLRMNLEYSLIPPGFERGYLDFLQRGDAIRKGSVRAIGTFWNPLPFGAGCAMTVPLAIHFARFSKTRFRRSLGFIAAALLLVAVPTSVARSSLIVLTVSMLVYAIALPLRRIAAILFGLAGALVVIAFASFNTLQSLTETINESGEDPSVLIRIIQNEKMMEIFEEYPVAGKGLGSMTIVDAGVVDNSTTFILAEGGLIGATAYLAMVLGGILGINASLRRATTKAQRDQAYATGAMFLGLVSAAPTFAILGHDPTYSMFFLLFGVLWSGCSYSLSSRAQPSASAGKLPSAMNSA